MTSPQDACSYNFVDPTRIPDRAPRICDVSLRDGEQTIDAAFDVDETVEVIRRLQDAGVDTVQVGFASSAADREAVARAHADGVTVPLELILVGLSESWRESVEQALEAGVDGIQVFVRSSPGLLESMGLTQQFLLDRVTDVVALVKASPGVTVAAGPSFATATDRDFLDRIYAAASAAGADQLVINDTLGVASPDAMTHLVAHLVDEHDVPIRVHCHNDFGLATANALASWQAGAALVDVAVAGLGERAGNVPLEELAIALARLYDRPSSVDTTSLVDLAQFMAELLHNPIPPNKAVVGANGFAQMVEMHVRVAKDHPELFETYDPALVGGRREIRLGKGSGPVAVASKLDELGIEAAPATVEGLVTAVNAFATEHKRALTDDDVRAAVTQLR